MNFLKRLLKIHKSQILPNYVKKLVETIKNASRLNCDATIAAIWEKRGKSSKMFGILTLEFKKPPKELEENV